MLVIEKGLEQLVQRLRRTEDLFLGCREDGHIEVVGRARADGIKSERKARSEASTALREEDMLMRCSYHVSCRSSLK